MDGNIVIGRSLDGSPVSQPAVAFLMEDIGAAFVNEVELVHAASNVEVDMAAITNAQLEYLIITADDTAAYGSSLTVKLGSSGGAAWNIIAPVTVSGQLGTLLTAMAGAQTVDKLFFSNTTGSTVNMRVEMYYSQTP